MLNTFQNINKRFRRLESHVITLARSVAHLSWQMRTQHMVLQVPTFCRIFNPNIQTKISSALQCLRPKTYYIPNNFQEMEHIRDEISALKVQANMAIIRLQSQPAIQDPELPMLSNPIRVRKLTKFFGAEPPLIRLFLRELGYEVRRFNISYQDIIYTLRIVSVPCSCI